VEAATGQLLPQGFNECVRRHGLLPTDTFPLLVPANPVRRTRLRLRPTVSAGASHTSHGWCSLRAWPPVATRGLQTVPAGIGVPAARTRHDAAAAANVAAEDEAVMRATRQHARVAWSTAPRPRSRARGAVWDGGGETQVEEDPVPVRVGPYAPSVLRSLRAAGGRRGRMLARWRRVPDRRRGAVRPNGKP
jgi:hypothetical protein